MNQILSTDLNIIVTRPSPYGEALVQLCQKANISAVHIPFFEMIKGKDYDNLQEKLNRLKNNDLIIVVSPQVNLLLKESTLIFPKNCHYFAIGKKTALSFQSICNKTVRYPVQENSEGLLLFLKQEKIPISKQKILILGGNITRNILQNELTALNAQVELVECYQRKIIHYAKNIFQLDQEMTFVVTSLEHFFQLDAYCTNYQKDHNYDQYHQKNSMLIVSSELVFNSAKLRNWQKVYLVESSSNQNLFKTILALCHNKVNQ